MLAEIVPNNVLVTEIQFRTVNGLFEQERPLTIDVLLVRAQFIGNRIILFQSSLCKDITNPISSLL